MQVTTTATGTSVASVPVSAGATADLLSVKPEIHAAETSAAVDAVSLSSAAGDAGLKNPESETRLYQRSTSVTAVVDEAQQQSASDQQLDAEEIEQVQELKQRDQEVRAHEQAHASAGGQHTGTTSFTYQTGPDGVRYAVGGEVSVDVSAVPDDPEATLDKMEQIQRAALAPAEPSTQDRQIAAEAGQKAAQALNEISQQQLQQRQADLDQRQEQQAEAAETMAQARAEQEEAREKEAEEQAVSTAERNAEYNAKIQRINEVLLKISQPPPVSAGQLLDDVI